MSKSFAGIDVSQDKLDVHVLPAALARTFPNTPEGHRKLVETLRSHAADGLRAVLESTGGMELPAALAIEAAGFEVAIVPPARVLHFAKAQPRRAKTDAIDAILLARFASTVEVEIHPLPSKEIRDFRDLLDRRGQLVEMRIMEFNRIKSTHHKPARDSIAKHIEWIEEELGRLEKEIDGMVAANAQWKRIDEIVQSVPGVGPQTSHALIGQMPELGHVHNKRAAHLVGLAPLAKDSGKGEMPRHIVGGRKHLRNTLYMAALAATRHNPVAKAMYSRLRSAGKLGKVALIAVARKLLTILNTMVKNNTPWRDLTPAIGNSA